MAAELGLQGHSSPTTTSPIRGATEAQYMVRETLAVAIGRVIGYRRQASIETVVRARG
jgi:hypothetical protein